MSMYPHTHSNDSGADSGTTLPSLTLPPPPFAQEFAVAEPAEITASLQPAPAHIPAPAPHTPAPIAATVTAPIATTVTDSAPAQPMPARSAGPAAISAPEIDSALQPARPFVVPNPGVGAAVQRSSRLGASAYIPAAVEPAQHQPQPVAPPQAPGISGIFDSTPATEPALAVSIPDAGPSSAELAPGAGLLPEAASVAATPAAWYGGRVEIDDEMMVWNAPSTTVSHLEPLSPPATTAAGSTATAAATFDRTPAGGSASGSTMGLPLRLLLLVVLPAAVGIGIALSLNRFVF